MAQPQVGSRLLSLFPVAAAVGDIELEAFDGPGINITERKLFGVEPRLFDALLN
jgi:hypothetical protein